MIFGWWLFVDVAILFARYFKAMWPNSQPCNLKIWFHVRKFKNFLDILKFFLDRKTNLFSFSLQFFFIKIFDLKFSVSSGPQRYGSDYDNCWVRLHFCCNKGCMGWKCKF